jgi:hypothetical protein
MSAKARAEFERLGISPVGFHVDDRAACRKAWDDLGPEYSCDAQITAAEEWLSRCDRTTKISEKGGSSYSLKHRAERWAKRYISNGALIMAAHRLSFHMSPIPRTPNVFFNIAVDNQPGMELWGVLYLTDKQLLHAGYSRQSIDRARSGSGGILEKRTRGVNFGISHRR